MSRKHKFHNKEGLYFVSFATVNWIDVFVREQYMAIVVDSLNFCKQNLGLQIFCWCIMPSHLHLIIRATGRNPEIVLGRFKEFTSKSIQKAIELEVKESRKEWMLWMFRRAGKRSSNVSNRQFWQHHNKPIELWSNEVIDQKVDYIHLNPVVAGFVVSPEDWKYSSAIDFAGGKGQIELNAL